MRSNDFSGGDYLDKMSQVRMRAWALSATDGRNGWVKPAYS